ncbi:hypothetical protein U2G59_004517 [Vibrio alginolyticus]|nr:hypothetical protein [Vibrio alginolyticus]
MNLENIYQSYADKMTGLHLYQRAMQRLVESECNQIAELEKFFKENSHLKSDAFSYDKMNYIDAETGESIFFGKNKSSLQDSKRHLLTHKNKQYQWLLVEAYEEFEDVLESLYAYAGYKDHNFWSLRDFGSITLSQLSCQDYSWFLSQAVRKKDAPSSIINAFRVRFPKIKEIEVNNSFGINLFLAINLLEMLRHLIVHNGGVALDKEEFKNRVLKKSELYNNGKPESQYVEFIEYYFGTGNDSNHINMLEKRLCSEYRLPVYINTFDELTGYLMAYVNEITKRLNEAKA